MEGGSLVASMVVSMPVHLITVPGSVATNPVQPMRLATSQFKVPCSQLEKSHWKFIYTEYAILDLIQHSIFVFQFFHT